MGTVTDEDLPTEDVVVPDVDSDDVQRKIEEYRKQIDSLYGHIAALLKVLKNQKDDASKESASLLKSKLEQLQGEMDEIERETIRSLATAANNSTDSVVDSVNKAMLAARLNHRVKSLENRLKVLLR